MVHKHLGLLMAEHKQFSSRTNTELNERFQVAFGTGLTYHCPLLTESTNGKIHKAQLVNSAPLLSRLLVTYQQ